MKTLEQPYRDVIRKMHPEAISIRVTFHPTETLVTGPSFCRKVVTGNPFELEGGERYRLTDVLELLQGKGIKNTPEAAKLIDDCPELEWYTSETKEMWTEWIFSKKLGVYGGSYGEEITTEQLAEILGVEVPVIEPKRMTGEELIGKHVRLPQEYRGDADYGFAHLVTAFNPDMNEVIVRGAMMKPEAIEQWYSLESKEWKSTEVSV